MAKPSETMGYSVDGEGGTKARVVAYRAKVEGPSERGCNLDPAPRVPTLAPSANVEKGRMGRRSEWSDLDLSDLDLFVDFDVSGGAKLSTDLTDGFPVEVT